MLHVEKWLKRMMLIEFLNNKIFFKAKSFEKNLVVYTVYLGMSILGLVVKS